VRVSGARAAHPHDHRLIIVPARGTSEKGSARREEILTTALRVISERGYHGTTLRGIGRELGVEPAHLLYYFTSREDLLREVIQRWDAGSFAVAGEGADSLEVFSGAIAHNVEIRGVLHLYLGFAAEAVDPQHPAHAFFRDRFAVNVAELAAAIRTGQQEGSVLPELHPERTARMLMALADGLQLQALMDPAVDAPAELDAALDALFVDGVRRPIGRPAELR
jgi:AcrR family transcriptional regulator